MLVSPFVLRPVHFNQGYYSLNITLTHQHTVFIGKITFFIKNETLHLLSMLDNISKVESASNDSLQHSYLNIKYQVDYYKG